MGYGVAAFVYYTLYGAMYALPLLALAGVLRWLGIDPAALAGDLWQLLRLVLVLIVLLLPGYRAKLAADAHAGGATFLQAHAASGATLRVHLSFLPIVGRFFGRDE